MIRRGATNGTSMGIRTKAVRFMAFALAATLSWSLWAICAEGAMSTPSAQMACCKNGHHACHHTGSPADCCKTTLHANPFTAVGKIRAPLPSFFVAQAIDSVPVIFPPSPSPRALPSNWSPPGTKHPTYLRLSTLRL